MAHAATIEEYCSVLIRSKLLPESEIAALARRFRSEAKDDDVDGFRRFLVQKKCLTDYQAALVQRGRSDGFTIGGYVIQDRIGKGQSAGVYKAKHPSGQIVAVKVLPGSKAKEDKALNRFRREGRLLTHLNHPNVVRAYHIAQDGAVWFIAMEFIDGETLEELLARRKKLSVPEAVRLVQQVLAGLQHLHERRMIHRDLKPANIMLTAASGADTMQSTVKILDIGIGRAVFDDDDPETQDIQLTAEGAILGTPDYLAPEQARDARTADIRSDLYSLGCVLFHLIAGRPPFQERNVMATMVKHATEAPAPLASVAAGVPAGLQAVFDKLTAKKPADRYADPAEAEDALSPFLPGDGTEAEESTILPAFKQWLDTETSLEMPPELKKLGTAPVSSLPPAPKPKPPGTTATAPLPVAKPATATTLKLPLQDLEVNVELMPWPPALPAVALPMPRSLIDLDRRDFLMLAAGAVGVALAGVVGLGMARLFRKVGDVETPPTATTGP